MIYSLDKYSGVRHINIKQIHRIFGIDDVLFGILISTGAGLIGSAIGNAVNTHNVKETNKVNQEINQNNIDYNTAMTREQWERDDTAHQREVADLKAAGLSPIANLGGLQSSSPLGAPTPIAMQAPQIDTNSIVQSILQAEQLKEQKREFDISAGQKESELKNEADRISVESKSVDLQDKKLNNEFQIATEQNALRAQEIENYQNQLEEVKRSNKEKERQAEEKRLFEEYSKRTEQMVNDAYKHCPEFVGGIKYCFNAEELATAQQSYNNTMSALIKELNSIKNANRTTFSKVDGEVNAGIKMLGSVDVGGEINTGYSKDLSDKRQAIINKYKAQLKMPRLVSEEDRDLFDNNGNLKYRR